MVVQTVRGADALEVPKHWSGSVAAHQGEGRWGILGSPHRHALSELAGPARGGHVPPPRRLEDHHAVDRSHGADTRLTGTPQAGGEKTSRIVIWTPRGVPVVAFTRKEEAYTR